MTNGDRGSQHVPGASQPEQAAAVEARRRCTLAAYTAKVSGTNFNGVPTYARTATLYDCASGKAVGSVADGRGARPQL